MRCDPPVQANSDKSMLVLELSEMKLRHEAEIKRLTQEHKKAIHAMKVGGHRRRVGLYC